MIRAGHEEHKQIWTPDTIIYEAIESDFQIPGGVQPCVEINQCAGCTRQFVTPSSRRRVDGVEDDGMIQHERAVKF